MNATQRWVLLSCSILFLAAEPSRSDDKPTDKAPTVPVARPVERAVAEYLEFAGRTQAVETIQIRARVSGYLLKVHFKEGDTVRKGDALFEIDPRPYQAQLDQALTQLAVSEASLKVAKATL